MEQENLNCPMERLIMGIGSKGNSKELEFINWLGDSDLKEKNVIEIIESLKNI